MERPVILKAHEVRGIIDGRQTQLRRIIKPQPAGKEVFQRLNRLGRKVWTSGYNGNEGLRVAFGQFECPFGQVGGRLWGREAFVAGSPLDGNENFLRDKDGDILPEKVWYRADDDLDEWLGDNGCVTDRIPWKSSTQMARWASRILLEIVSVRVERVQDISENDAIANGAFESDRCTARLNFMRHRDDAYGNGAQAASPWVWVVEFMRVAADE